MTNISTPIFEIKKSRLIKVASDPAKSAGLFNLNYISDSEPGYTRKKRAGKLFYYKDGKLIKDIDTLNRIRKLAIPPAWENVWISFHENGHLQATGIDVKGRKQYRYHPLWNQMRNETKYFRLHEFGKNIPSIREQIERDLSSPGTNLKKVLATIVSLMERTSIRVGNSFYEKLYGSFGLTTLKDKHVKIKGSDLEFTFVGKKGVHHTISLKSKRLATIVMQCKDIPGKELFQFYDDDGKRHAIHSGMVNEYIREISGGDFSSKDFRTWSGTIHALETCKAKGDCEGVNEMKHRIVETLDEVARHLGNTRTVCKKYYVHPVVLELYETHQLFSFLDQVNNLTDDSRYAPEEKVLMRILESHAKNAKMISVVG